MQDWKASGRSQLNRPISDLIPLMEVRMMGSPSQHLPLWQSLVLELFRLAVRIALRLHRVSLSELRGLLDIALVQELEAQGHSNRQLSVVLNCSTNTVKALLAMPPEGGSSSDGSSHPRRLLTRLAQGPCDEEELDPGGRLRAREDFDGLRALTRVLTRQGLIEPMKLRRSVKWRLTSTGLALVQHPLEGHWSTLEDAYQLECQLLERVQQKPCSVEALAELLGRDVADIEMLVRELVASGVLISESGTAGASAVSPAVPHLLRVPEEPARRLRLGLQDYFRNTGAFVDVVLSDTPSSLIGQRAMTFRALPSELETWIEHHRTQVLSDVQAMEARADAAGGGQLCRIFWGISPVILPPALTKKSSPTK